MKIPDIKQLFSHKSKKSNHSFVIMRPNHDWKIIIYSFVSLLLVFFAFSFYFLDRVKKDTLFKVNKIGEERATTVNQALLEKILGEFKAKSERINNFPTDTYFTVDPGR